MQVQLLNLFDEQPSWDNFIDLGNEHIIASIRSNNSPFMHISGTLHSGKSHLLKAWCNSHANSLYQDMSKSSILDIASYNYIAIDNVEYASIEVQEQLFNLFNAVKLHAKPQHLFTSSENPLEHITTLRLDLKTRLLSGLNLHLKMPNDEVLTQIITRYIKSQGINISDTVISYIFTHYTRNIGDIFTLIKLAVAQALIQKTNITIPLIKSLINHEA